MSIPAKHFKPKELEDTMKFTKIGDILDGKHTGKKIAIRGWVHRERKQKSISFFVIRDDSGIIQTAIKPDSKYWSEAEKVTRESSVILEGEVKEDKRAPGGFEISVSKMEIVGLAERFPITKDQSEEFLRDVRHLWIRSREMTLKLKIRGEVFKAIRDFFASKRFTEIQSPILTTSACEGGSTLFHVKHPDTKVYLSQSWQLHAEAMITSLQKIYTITPAFRAEKSRTIRHLAEYWTAEWEMAWGTHEELMELEEDLIVYVVKHVLKHSEKELEELGRDKKELEKIKKPFLRITYADAIKKLGKKYGEDITDKEERDMVKEYRQPVFLTHFPRDMKAFYMLPSEKDPKVVEASDLLIPGVGETIGGSARIHELKDLMESIKLFKLDPEEYKWYIDLRKYGSVPHCGAGLGIERLVMWLTGSEHVMDTIPFPRTMSRMSP